MSCCSSGVPKGWSRCMSEGEAGIAGVLTTSRRLSRHPGLARFLGCPVHYYRTGVPVACHAVIAWGRKPSARKAERLAQQFGLPLWRLEDGFIHSLGQGVLGDRSCSLVCDPLGIYYDATRPSALEQWLETGHGPDASLSDPQLQARGQQLMIQLVQAQVSKYNNAPLTLEQLPLPDGPKVLVVDQTAGDMSLAYGLVSPQAYQGMVTTALKEHPEATVLVKVHPDVLAGRKQGCVVIPDHPRVVRVAAPVNPLVLLEQVQQVYVLTSQLGFEALMLGRPVTCFGMPFYAGWGVTDDRADAGAALQAVRQRRTARRTVTDIFVAAYLLYSRYLHPDTSRPCTVEALVDYFALQNRLWRETPGQLFCFGFTRWKQNYIRRFLSAPGNRLDFIWKAQAARQRGFGQPDHGRQQLVVWGERALGEAQQLAVSTGMPVWRVEDGFIRSVGLGSDYTAPLSLVLDQRGIYFDPAAPSDLEHLLASTDFVPALLARAKALRVSLLQSRLSKYNAGDALPARVVTAKQGRRTILVPGQVEDDASIRCGCPDICTNAGLLRQVRMQCPDAFIIFKPHPDVVSGNRRGAVSVAVAQQYCDIVLADVSVVDCLDVADEVHTLTSLVGFEALLRDKKVCCYGLPFYAGWGLTTDRHRLERRERRLVLDELVAAALILYPRYVNPETGAFTTPEQVLEILAHQLAAQGGRKKNKINRIGRLLVQAWHICQGVFSFRP